MSLYKTLYFMSLVGGMAGLFSWVLTALVSTVLVNPPAWAPDLFSATILGSFIGGLTVAFSDHWSGNRVLPRWVISGILIGMTAGIAAGLVQIPITSNLGEQAPVLTRLIAWMLAGSFIGFGLGLRWVGVNRARVAHAFAGGLIGARWAAWSSQGWQPLFPIYRRRSVLFLSASEFASESPWLRSFCAMAFCSL